VDTDNGDVFEEDEVEGKLCESMSIMCLKIFDQTYLLNLACGEAYDHCAAFPCDAFQGIWRVKVRKNGGVLYREDVPRISPTGSYITSWENIISRL
jgi:hypothetical protein